MWDKDAASKDKQFTQDTQLYEQNMPRGHKVSWSWNDEANVFTDDIWIPTEYMWSTIIVLC